jgi:hypothetical protein
MAYFRPESAQPRQRRRRPSTTPPIDGDNRRRLDLDAFLAIIGDGRFLAIQENRLSDFFPSPFVGQVEGGFAEASEELEGPPFWKKSLRSADQKLGQSAPALGKPMAGQSSFSP